METGHIMEKFYYADHSNTLKKRLLKFQVAPKMHM